MLTSLRNAWRNPKLPFRRHFVVFALISLFALAQLTWWSIFQFHEGQRIVATQEHYWSQQIALASEKRHDLGPAFEDWLLRAFPDLESAPGGSIRVSAAARARLDELAGSRMRMFLSEGAFFGLLVLIGVLYMFRTLREEIAIEHRQSVFLTATSHELKTPITSLRMYLDTLRERELSPPKRAEMLEVMSVDLDRLNDLIERLLQAQKVLTPDAMIANEFVDVSEETLRAVKEMTHRIEFSGKHHLNVDTEYGLHASADPRRWQLVVKNLVDNAVKYSPDGGMIDVYLAKRERWIELSVVDQGCGFDADEAPRLFERFYRSGNEDTRTTQGIGLGLYLVREIVHSMRGRVAARSDGPGKGSKFVVQIPLLKEHDNG